MNMEAKTNIAEILKDKPQGTKLYDLLYNVDVELDTVSTTDTETVVWCTNETDINTTCHRGYSEFGTVRGCPDGLQILLPSKEMRDWRKFAWKKGDVLLNDDGKFCIFESFAHSSYSTFKSKLIKHEGPFIKNDTFLADTKDWHKESDDVSPKKCEFKPFDKVLVRDHLEDKWMPNFFSRYDGTSEYKYGCIAGNSDNVFFSKYCIPYNDETKHLFGTTDEWKGGEG